MKFKAFTLTELLIAISVLAIVLVLTVPSMVNNMINKGYVATLQRVYLSVSDAVKMTLQDERTKDVKNTYLYKTDSESIESTAGVFIKKYFKLSVDCKTSKRSCFADSYMTLNKSKNVSLPSDGNMYCALLATKASVCLVPLQGDANGMVYVDVNGPAKPNVAGRDLFLFYIYSDGYVGDKDNNANNCYDNTSAVGCFNKLARSNWIMNY